jgi:hypothetical protein
VSGAIVFDRGLDLARRSTQHFGWKVQKRGLVVHSRQRATNTDFIGKSQALPLAKANRSVVATKGSRVILTFR